MFNIQTKETFVENEAARLNNAQTTGGCSSLETSDIHYPYLPDTQADRQAMLEAIGVSTFDQLISNIPASVRAKPLTLPRSMSELELVATISNLAKKNNPTSNQMSFLGAGSYRRFVPSIVPAVISRSEFATAYTPYQAEISQGNLQTIYEYQTAICLLTNMDVANASMYDGPTACAEAALMASRVTGRKKIIVSSALNPEYAAVTKTYVHACDLELEKLTLTEGATAATTISEETAAVIVQYPNYFGILEELQALADAAHKAQALLIVVSDPISLAYLTPPGDFHADIVVGDAQPCGNNLSFGGPSAGFMACRKEYVRQLPGRLVGATLDSQQRRAYTLTLQAREQHIRRAHATSNICTNQALNALAMLVYLSAMGPGGLKAIANLSLQKAHYLADKLVQIPGVMLAFKKPYFSEFAITTPKPAAHVLKQLEDKGILGGIDLANSRANLNNGILIAVTEMNKKDELDAYAAALQGVLNMQ